MGTKLNPKEELMVLMAVKELKEASLVEVGEFVTEKWKLEISRDNLTRYLRRWKKGKVLAANMIGDQWFYSIRDIPWYPEAQMIHVVKSEMSETETREWLENYREELKERGFVEERIPIIRDFEDFQVTLEVADAIAGGLLSDDNEKLLKFPRSEGQPVIPRGWIIGWLRDNARLVNALGIHMRQYVGCSTGKFLEEPKIKTRSVIGKVGPQTHEYVPAGSQFTLALSYPMHGTMIRSEEELRTFFEKIERTPIRGLGAYSKAFGGNIKVVEMKKLDL